MIKTKYDLQLEQKQAKRLKNDTKKTARKLKRKNRRLARRAKREKKRFLRKSNAKFRVWHRLIIKTVRVGGPVSAFAYVIWKLVGTFKLETEDVVGKMNLDNAVMLLFFGTIVFIFALYFGFKWLKTAIASNAVARNQGIPSLTYSPVIITFIRALLSMWFFGLMWLFNYIGLHYGESLNNGMNHMMIAFLIGFGSLMVADVIEQRILHGVRNAKHIAEDESREMIYNLTHPENIEEGDE